MHEVMFKKATKEDAALLLAFIHELAVYEKAADRVEVTLDRLQACLFGDEPYAHALLVYQNGNPAGYALYFYNYSSYLGKPGIYLEDLYIKPELRGNNLGTKALAWLAQLANDKDCAFMSWNVLDWNKPAMDFYNKVGGKPSSCVPYKLTGDKLKELADYLPS